jgi:hypothetical protein
VVGPLNVEPHGAPGCSCAASAPALTPPRSRSHQWWPCLPPPSTPRLALADGAGGVRVRERGGVGGGCGWRGTTTAGRGAPRDGCIGKKNKTNR